MKGPPLWPLAYSHRGRSPGPPRVPIRVLAQCQALSSNRGERCRNEATSPGGKFCNQHIRSGAVSVFDDPVDAVQRARARRVLGDE